MPRRREVPKREVLPDSRYNSELVAKFVNVIMRDGKKSVAEGILYDAFDLIQQRAKEAPLEVFEKALNNVKPVIEVKSRRVGGSTYQIPMEVRFTRRAALAMKWIMTYSRSRSEKNMSAKLAGELLDAFNNRGASVKKKEDTHRMAEANKAFAHYRW
ncbi:MAG: 30S ribosomal protein S7 [Desulfatibacillum sp.]|nr:30S ribosomal protein S7 [Desulfatibacillum sp.]